MNKQFRVVDLAYMAVCAALIAICSWISIPAAVPFTMQTFAVFCVLGLLGGKRGTISILVYILLGAVGLPVFAGFSGGIGILFGTTGGYIIGFIFVGLIYWAAEKLFGAKLPLRIAAMVLGLAVCFICFLPAVLIKKLEVLKSSHILSWEKPKVRVLQEKNLFSFLPFPRHSAGARSQTAW